MNATIEPVCPYYFNVCFLFGILVLDSCNLQLEAGQIWIAQGTLLFLGIPNLKTSDALMVTNTITKKILLKNFKVNKQ